MGATSDQGGELRVVPAVDETASGGASAEALEASTPSYEPAPEGDGSQPAEAKAVNGGEPEHVEAEIVGADGATTDVERGVAEAPREAGDVTAAPAANTVALGGLLQWWRANNPLAKLAASRAAAERQTQFAREQAAAQEEQNGRAAYSHSYGAEHASAHFAAQHELPRQPGESADDYNARVEQRAAEIFAMRRELVQAHNLRAQAAAASEEAARLREVHQAAVDEHARRAAEAKHLAEVAAVAAAGLAIYGHEVGKHDRKASAAEERVAALLAQAKAIEDKYAKPAATSEAGEQ